MQYPAVPRYPFLSVTIRLIDIGTHISFLWTTMIGYSVAGAEATTKRALLDRAFVAELCTHEEGEAGSNKRK